MIRWMIFSMLATGLFWGLYRLTLGRDRWLQLSRAYLIIMLAFGLAYPLLRLPGDMRPVVFEIAALEEVTVMPDADGGTLLHLPEASTASNIGADWVLPAVYAGGVAVALVLLMFSIIRMLARLRRMPFERQDGVKLTLLDDESEPFSFFNHIVVGTRGMSDEELRLVLAHESEHVRQWHSWDVFIMRLMCCVAWFNPFAWLMLRELRAVHEYQADNAALQEEEDKGYLRLLFRQTLGFGYGHITNNFHSINLKKRITMMKRTKTRFGAWKVLAALPVVALLMMVGCQPAESPKGDTTAVTPQKEEPVYDMGPTQLADGEEANVVDESPEYPGGMEALYKYLAENIHYPEQAKNDQIQGRVVISFVVEKDGGISDAKVVRGIGGGCDEEALRVVNAMPKWTPGKMRGDVVRVNFHLPITFKLQ